jgi:Sec-independent protein translocase protein TatA
MLFFGNKDRIGELARWLGKFSGEFKKGKREVEEEIKEVKEELEIK